MCYAGLKRVGLLTPFMTWQVDTLGVAWVVWHGLCGRYWNWRGYWWCGIGVVALALWHWLGIVACLVMGTVAWWRILCEAIGWLGLVGVGVGGGWV